MSEPPHEARKVMVLIGLDERLTTRAAELLIKLDLEPVAERVTVTWNKRLRTTAGRAYSGLAKIELNPRLQLLPDEEKKENEINQTFLHELAHVVAFARHGRNIKPHGDEWKKACADLGIPGEDRCHELNLGGRTTMRKNFAYICPVCEEVIFRVRRMKRSVACYSCCKVHNQGKFDPRFKLIEKRLG